MFRAFLFHRFIPEMYYKILILEYILTILVSLDITKFGRWMEEKDSALLDEILYEFQECRTWWSNYFFVHEEFHSKYSPRQSL